MSDTLEHWLPVVGYDFEYEVSDLGNVRRVDTGKLVPQHATTKRHYKAVALCKDSKYVSVYVHRLVCTAFHPNTEHKPCVDHINTQPADNRACNLRWVTAQENANNSLSLQHNSEAQHRRMQRPEERSKLRTKALQNAQDPDFIAKQSASDKIRWSDPDERRKQSERTTLYFANPDNREKARQLKQNVIKACQCIETGVVYESFMDAQRATGISAANISRTCRAYATGKILHAGGYTWCYPIQTTAS